MKINNEKLRTLFSENPIITMHFFLLATEINDLAIDKTYIGTRLPFAEDDATPPIMIAYMKGKDAKRGRDVEAVVFEECEHPSIMKMCYLPAVWGQYDPRSYKDFENLPALYLISFYENQSDKLHPIIHSMTIATEEKDGKEVRSYSVDTGCYGHFVNTAVDSQIMRLIHDAVEEQ